MSRLSTFRKAFVRALRSLLEGEMARATVLKTSERFDLKTLPPVDGEEGGWVELRRLSYGEKLRKDADAMKLRFRPDENKEVNAEVGMISEVVTIREFSLCVVAHNLTKPNPQDPDNRAADLPLDLRRAEDVRELDPRVGDEISQLIGSMNDFEREARESTRDAAGK